MPFLNEYVAPPPLEVKLWHAHTPLEKYDLNFCFPIPDLLKSSGVILMPTIPSLHASSLHALFARYPALYEHLPSGPFPTQEGFFTWLEQFRSDPTSLFFTIFDQSLSLLTSTPSTDDSLSSLRIAGFVSAVHCSAANRTADIGLAVAPPFQRSHVTTHAVGLMMKWLFEDVGLRKIIWTANDLNLGSVATAERIGYRKEGYLRWAQVQRPGKMAGWELPSWATEEERERGLGRHSWYYGLGWDEWRDGREGKEPVKERVRLLMAKPVTNRPRDSLKW